MSTRFMDPCLSPFARATPLSLFLSLKVEEVGTPTFVYYPSRKDGKQDLALDFRFWIDRKEYTHNI